MIVECQLPDRHRDAAGNQLPATTTSPRRMAGEQGENRTAGSGEELAAGGWWLTADSFALPKAIWLNETLKTVDVIREIWEVEDEWWRNHIARRYFDVILDGGKHLIVYQDRLTGKWYAQTA